MKNVKRFLSLILVLALLITSSISLMAEADSSNFVSSNEIEVDFGEAEKDNSTNIFKSKTNEFEIDHEYNQYIGLDLEGKNGKEVTFKIVNNHDDLYVGFGAGNEDAKVSLTHSGMSLDIYANAQNAKNELYEIEVQAYDGANLIETAKIIIKIRNMELDITTSQSMDARGNVILNIVNNSSTISDLTLKLPEKYASLFALQSTVNNYYLRSGDNVNVTIVPNFEELLKLTDREINFSVLLTGNGKEKEVNVNYVFNDGDIEKKTIKEYMDSRNIELEEEFTERKFGRFDFQNGELKLSEINEWPEEISIKADEIKIIDDNTELQSTRINAYDETDYVLDSKEIMLKANGDAAYTLSAISYQRLDFDITGKDNGAYTREIRIIKPSEKIEYSDKVIELDKNTEEEIIKDFNSESVKIDGDFIQLDVGNDSHLNDKIIRGEVKQGDIIFLPDYDDGENVMIASYLKIVSIDENNVVKLTKATMDEIYADGTMIECSASSASDFAEKYTYDIVNGFRVENTRVNTMAYRGSGEGSSGDGDGGAIYNDRFVKLDPFEISDNVNLELDLTDNISLTIKPKAFAEVSFNTQGLQKGENGFFDFVFKKNSYYYAKLRRNIIDCGAGIKIEFEIGGKKHVIDDSVEVPTKIKDKLVETAKNNKSEKSKCAFEFSGIDYEDRFVLFAKGLGIETLASGVPVDWETGKASPVVLWFIVYLDSEGKLKIDCEYKYQAFIETDELTVGLKQKNVKASVFGLDDDVKPVYNDGEVQAYFVISPEKPKVSSYSSTKISVMADFKTEMGIALAIGTFGNIIGDLSTGFGMEIKGGLTYCNDKSDGISSLDRRLLFDDDDDSMCEANGDFCFEGNLNIYLIIKPRFKVKASVGPVGISVNYDKDFLKYDLLDETIKSGNCQEDTEKPELHNPKLINECLELFKKIFLDKDKLKKNDKNKVKIPTGGKKAEKKKSYPSIIITSKGRQCINARHREWNLNIPYFESIKPKEDKNFTSNATMLYADENYAVDLLGLNNNDSSFEESTENKKPSAYLISHIDIDKEQKNKYEEFKYYLNDRVIGESKLDIGGYQIFPIRSDAGLSAGSNILKQTNTHTNPGSYVVQTDTNLIIPLSESDTIYLYKRNPVVEIANPFIDMAVDTSSVKFKNPYPGLINSMHEFTAKVLNVGTKPCRAGVSLYEESDTEERLLDFKVEDFEAMSEKQMTFNFKRKENCKYKLEVLAIDSKNNEAEESRKHNNQDYLKIDEIKEDQIKPDISVVSYNPLNIRAKSNAGARIKYIKLFKNGEKIYEKEIDHETKNKTYCFEQNANEVDEVEVTDEYGTNAHVNIDEKSEEQEYNVKLAEKPIDKFAQIRVDYRLYRSEVDNDNNVILRTYKNSKKEFMLNYDNVFYFIKFNEDDKLIDLSNKKLIRQEFKLSEGVKIKNVRVSTSGNEDYYSLKKDNINDNNILLSEGKYTIEIGAEKGGVYFNKRFDVKIKDVEPKPLDIDADVSDSILIRIDADSNIEYHARVGNIEIPKEGIRISKKDRHGGIEVTIVGKNHSYIYLYKEIDVNNDNTVNLKPLNFKLNGLVNVSNENIFVGAELENNEYEHYSINGYIIRVRDAATGEITYAYASLSENRGSTKFRISKTDLNGKPIVGKKFISLCFNKADTSIINPDDKEENDYDYDYDYNAEKEDNLYYRRPHRIINNYKETADNKAKGETANIYEAIALVTIGSNNFEKTVNGVHTVTLMDVAAQIKNGRTMLPIRYVAEALGFNVAWIKETRTVVIYDIKYKVEIPVDTNTIIVNGVKFESDVKPQLVNNRTLLPIANIARALGLKDGTDILWNPTTRQATIIRRVYSK